MSVYFVSIPLTSPVLVALRRHRVDTPSHSPGLSCYQRAILLLTELFQYRESNRGNIDPDHTKAFFLDTLAYLRLWASNPNLLLGIASLLLVHAS